MSASIVYPNWSIEFVPTIRGGESLLCGGRRYHKKKIYTNGETFYQCSKKGCKGNLTLNIRNEVIKCSQIHAIDCEVDIQKNIMLINNDRILKQVQKLKTTLPEHNPF